MTLTQTSPPIEKLEDRKLLSVSIMTQNLYYGAGTDLADFASWFTDAWDRVEQTDFAERADAIAVQIARKEPQLIGLQEAAVWRTAKNVEQNFTRILQRALQRRGFDYVEVVRVRNTDFEFPALVDGRLRDLRYTDLDVILARSDVVDDVMRVDRGTFDDRVTFDISPLGDLTFKRGWVSADVVLDGRLTRFLNTHLEAFDSNVRFRQARELIRDPADTTLPTILTGDFNVDAGPGDRTYLALLAGGFFDTWTLRHGDREGFTCCQDDDLLNQRSLLSRRADLVLIDDDTLWRVRKADRVNESQRDRTESGRWPSDHAGLAVLLTSRATVITPVDADEDSPRFIVGAQDDGDIVTIPRDDDDLFGLLPIGDDGLPLEEPISLI